MKKILFISLFFLSSDLILGQAILHQGTIPLKNVFSSDSIHKIPTQVLSFNKSFPFPKGIDNDLKEKITQEKQLLNNNYQNFEHSKRAAISPTVETGFEGSMFAGIPNDNNAAVNNDSFVISVYNTQIRVYTTNGVFKKAWNLTFFPRDVNNTQPSALKILDRSYDPKIVFDPKSNRFIIVFLEGSESTDTRIIVCFSKTSNPLNGWNVYEINGNPIGGKLWTDYPMIAINNEDLFITVNILKDNTDWRDGFTESIIWQISMENGYNASTLDFNLWSNLKHNNRSIWSICPVQEAFLPGGKGLYFLSVRPGDAQNDTVFLHHISDNKKSGNAQYSYKILKNNLQYGLPPFASQNKPGYRLQTNDSRVLGAFYNNNQIQFVQTSRNFTNGRSSVLHSIIQYPQLTSASISSKLISYDGLDIAYPTIACAGVSNYGQQSLITFSHSSESVFPGTSVVYFNNNSEYSERIVAKEGSGHINTFLNDTMERWGDYTSIQRKYNQLNEFWISGSFGKSDFTNGTWLAKIKVNDAEVNITKKEVQKQLLDYPNPAKELITIPFITENEGTLDILILDSKGKIVYKYNQSLLKGNQQALINIYDLPQGIYHYQLIHQQQIIKNGSFSKI